MSKMKTIVLGAIFASLVSALVCFAVAINQNLRGLEPPLLWVTAGVFSILVALFSAFWHQSLINAPNDDFYPPGLMRPFPERKVQRMDYGVKGIPDEVTWGLADDHNSNCHVDTTPTNEG